MDQTIEGSTPVVLPEVQAAPGQARVNRASLARGVALALILGGIFLLAVYFRMVGRNWDENQLLHPDERFIAMVTGAVQVPKSLGEYFDTAKSSLNPYNKGFGSFVYGTLPLFTVRGVAEVGKDWGWLQSLLGVKNPLLGLSELVLLGRLLSSIFDLLTLGLLYFIARRLYDTRVAVLAVALGAFSVLNIQQAHYYTADTFANFFAILTFLFCVRVLQGARWWDYVGLGLAFGAAIGSRINLLTLVGLIAIAIGVRLLDAWRSRSHSLASADADDASPAVAPRASFDSVWLGGVLVILVALVTFRLIMPYAFQAPTASPMSWLKFNPQWQADMANAQRMNRGDVDVPFGHQWTDRAPLVFPWYNMVWFGLGIPLGLAAWLGWGIALWQLLAAAWPHRGEGLLSRVLDSPRLRAHILPVAWIGITFFFHGTQWVKSIRYFLQMYPIMALMGAWLLVVAWDWARTRDEARGLTSALTPRKLLAAALGLVVVGGTFLYALAFTNIYTEPVTRVAASRWIYENVPTAATVQLDTAGGPRQVQAPLPNKFTWAADNQRNATPFRAPADGTLSSVTLNFLTDPRRDADAEVIDVIVARDPGGQQPLARGQVTANLEQAGPRGMSVAARLDQGAGAPLQSGQDYFLVTRAVRGAPIATRNATLANEHWDDGIPLRLDGRDGFGIYQGVEMTNYDEDEPAKLDKLVDKMDQVDYIFMTSGRLYESIPRLPMRWPMTTRYYELMLNQPEALGFQRVAEFTNYAHLGPFVWNDDSSEEQFRVYDHPKVLIFQKLPTFDKAQAKQTLGQGIAWDKIERLWDKEATNVYNNARWRQIPLVGGLIANRLAPLQTERALPPAAEGPAAPKTDLLLPKNDWTEQQLGGSWASLFNPDALVNTTGFLAVLVWLVAVYLLGLAAFPIAFAIFPNLADRGWFSSKILGLLLVSYGAWLLASVQRFFPYGRVMVWLVFLATLAVGALFAWRQWAGLRAFVVSRRRDLLVGEGVFLALFVGFLLVRMSNPDLWHPFMGGEKPMDFAYFNAVIRAQFFPNYDPWFAGGVMNYYYYGFVMAATLVLMTGVMPAIAYNLTVPLFFALTGFGAFAVVYNIVAARWSGGDVEAEAGAAQRLPLLFGALGALFVAVVGNLGEVRLLSQGLQDISGASVQSNIPGLGALMGALGGIGKVLTGQAHFAFRQEWWYWNASRAIPHAQTEAVPITEFPYFTFLYGDLHAHMLTLPLTLLALALCLNVVLRGRGQWRLGTAVSGWPSVVAMWGIFGLVVGALRPANTWDYPTYLAIAVGAFALQAYQAYGLTGRAVAEALWRTGLLFILTNVLWLPFINNFATAFSSVERWDGSRTVWWSYLIVHGFFLFTIAAFLAFQVRDWYRSEVAAGRAGQAQRFILQALAVLVVIEALLAFANYGAWVMGLPFVVLSGLLLLRRPQVDDRRLTTDDGDGVSSSIVARPSSVSHPTPASSFILLIVAAAVSLTLLVEVVVLKGDISRMNTVFKFYLQVWVLLGVAAAASLAWVWRELEEVDLTTRTVWQTVFACLLFGVLLYPVFATWGRANDRFNDQVRAIGPTLNGMAYMDQAVYSDAPDGKPVVNYPLKYDRDAIEWLQENVQGTPVVAEAHTVEYRWGSRVSIYTGLPTIVGWSNHQRQQRSALTQPVVDQRGADVKTLFSTPDLNQARTLLQKYNVGYVYVGPTEKAYYPPEGLAKFERMAQQGMLEKVYTNEQVTVYRVVGGTPS